MRNSAIALIVVLAVIAGLAWCAGSWLDQVQHSTERKAQSDRLTLIENLR